MLLTSLLALAVAQAAGSPAPTPPPRPDCSAVEHRQFDFWVGDWDVVPNGAPPKPGQRPARNTVTKIENGCVLLEQWNAVTNTGQSFNIYDRSRGQWHQTWVDNAAVRLTFFDLGDGRVRQFSERLNADGTWSVNYDLLYTPHIMPKRR
ncbi:MAG: hypothetical protein IT177_21345 [Acidobacteria bacterium]|nr:hypothetical protein [Acidobacteriota bacterium]